MSNNMRHTLGSKTCWSDKTRCASQSRPIRRRRRSRPLRESACAAQGTEVSSAGSGGLKMICDRRCFRRSGRWRASAKPHICFFATFHAFSAFLKSKKQFLKKYGLLLKSPVLYFSLTFFLLFFITTLFFFHMISYLATLDLELDGKYCYFYFTTYLM